MILGKQVRASAKVPISVATTLHFTSGNVLFCGICLSVCHIPHITFVDSVLKRGRKFVFFGEVNIPYGRWTYLHNVIKHLVLLRFKYCCTHGTRKK